jgi:hypothetical protein
MIMINNNLCLIRVSVFRALCAAIIIFASANSALAQNWQIEPQLGVGGEYDDNSTLDPRTDNEIELSGLLLEASADFKYMSPVTTFFIQPRVLSRNYDDDSIADSDDLFLRSDFSRSGELSTVGFRFSVDDQSVRTGERLDSDLEIEDPDDIPNNDTGRVLRFGDRTMWRVAPYWEYQFSDLSSIGVDADYIDAEYDDVFAEILSDYSDVRLDLKYRRSLSDVTTWGIFLRGRRYDPKDEPDSIDGKGVFAEVEHALSEKTRVALPIGIGDTDEAGVETDTEVVGDITLIRNLETIRFFAQYRRSYEGSGAGVTIRDSFNLNFRRRLNERIAAGLGVRAYQSNRLSEPLGGDDLNYVQLQSNFVWYLSRSLVIEADYRYTVIDRGDDFEGRANSNRVNLWFVYRPNGNSKM